MVIYFPATCDLITPGHIKCIEWLRDYKKQKHPRIIVGLLTDKALKGYKKCVMSFKDRKYILDAIAEGIRDRWGLHCVEVVPQDSLNPYKNLKKYHPAMIASGDGFEPEEIKAAQRAKCQLLNIKLQGEQKKRYSSTQLKQKILCQQKS